MGLECSASATSLLPVFPILSLLIREDAISLGWHWIKSPPCPGGFGKIAGAEGSKEQPNYSRRSQGAFSKGNWTSEEEGEGEGE